MIIDDWYYGACRIGLDLERVGVQLHWPIGMTEKEKKAIDVYLAGILQMLNQCSTGANVHDVANIRTSLQMARELVQKSGHTEQVTYDRVRASVAPAVDRSKELYRHWEDHTGRIERERRSSKTLWACD